MKSSISTQKYFLLGLIFLVVAGPVWIWYQDASLGWSSFTYLELAPVLGLIAYSIMWLHIVGSPFKKQLGSIIDWQKFVDYSSLFVFVSLILHPLLLLIGLALVTDGGSVLDYAPSGEENLIYMAVVALVIFLAYDGLKYLRSKGTLVKNWRLIQFISTAAFFLVYFHSVGIGRDLRSGTFLLIVWQIMAATALLATIYSYIIRPYLDKQSASS